MSNCSLLARGTDRPFSHKSVVSILCMSRILFAAKHLFVGSHLELSDNEKEGKNTLNDDNIIIDRCF